MRSGLVTMGLAALLSGCGNPPYPRGDAKALFGDGPVPRTVQLPAQSRSIHTMQTADKGDGLLLFVHGSPGDWKAWAQYLKTPRLGGLGPRVAVDRPGFGGSDAGAVMPDLRAQAHLLAELIPDGRKAVVIGHSLGGPLAAWMAIDHPDKVCAAVSIAGSLTADLEQPRWYNRAADSRLVQWAIPPEMRWSNQEMMVLSSELRKLEGAWPQLRTPFVLMQGGKDSLVDPRTADEVEKLAPREWLSVQRLPAETHFVLWEKPDLVIDTILQLPCLRSAGAASAKAG